MSFSYPRLPFLILGLLAASSHQLELSSGVARPSGGLTNRTSANRADLGWRIQDEALIDLNPQTTQSRLDSSVKVACKDCRTWGGLSAKFANQDADEPSLQLLFDDFGGRFDFQLSTNGPTTTSTALLQSLSLRVPPNKFHLAGITAYLDVVFNVSDAISLDGGFHVSIPTNSLATVRVGETTDIIAMEFDNAEVQSIPIKVNSGAALLTVDLRLRVEASIDMKVPDFVNIATRERSRKEQVAGAWISLVEFTSDLTGSVDSCPPIENWDINAGAYMLDQPANRTIAVPSASATYYQLEYTPECAATINAAPPVASPSPGPDEGLGPIIYLPPEEPTPSPSFGIGIGAPPLVLPDRTLAPGSPLRPGAIIPKITATPSIPAYLGRRRASRFHFSFFNNTSTATSCLVPAINCPADQTRHIVWTKTVAPALGPTGTIGSGAVLRKRTADNLVMTDGTRLTSLAAPITKFYESTTEPTSEPTTEPLALPTPRLPAPSRATTITISAPLETEASTPVRVPLRSSVVLGIGLGNATGIATPTGTGSFVAPRQPSGSPVEVSGSTQLCVSGLGVAMAACLFAWILSA